MDDGQKAYKIYLNLKWSAARAMTSCTYIGVSSKVVNSFLRTYSQRSSSAEISTITCTLVGGSSDHPGLPCYVMLQVGAKSTSVRTMSWISQTY